MNIKKLFALALSAALILATFAGCRKVNGEMSSGNTSDISITIYGTVDFIENNSDDTQSTESTDSSADSTASSNISSGAIGTSSTDTTSVEDPTITVNPDGNEIYGEGNETTPYEDTPNADTHTVTSVSIPAGKSVYYNIYRVGGRILTINDANAYVVCDGTTYAAQNGVVSFKVPSALASDAVSFEIGNTGSAAANFTLTFSDETGSMANPQVLSSIGSKTTISLAEGNEVGHFYKYTAEKAGTIRFYLITDTDTAILLATNNNSMAQRSTESEEEGEVNTDSTGTYIELVVEKGDEISINVGAKPTKRGKYPAVTAEWLAKYA